MTISAQQVAIFAQYDGDSDGFALMANSEDRQVMTDDAWSRLNLLLTELAQLRDGLLAPAYAEEIAQRFAKDVPDEGVRATVRNLVGA